MIENNLVPKHEVLDPADAERILKEYDVTKDELPKIKKSDSALTKLKPKPGDIIKITRNNPFTGESYYYRVVIED